MYQIGLIAFEISDFNRVSCMFTHSCKLDQDRCMENILTWDVITIKSWFGYVPKSRITM